MEEEELEAVFDELFVDIDAKDSGTGEAATVTGAGDVRESICIAVDVTDDEDGELKGTSDISSGSTKSNDDERNGL